MITVRCAACIPLLTLAHARAAPLLVLSFVSGGPNSPFDMPFYLIVNLAIGGKYPGDSDSKTLSPNTMEVDYIRVFGQ